MTILNQTASSSQYRQTPIEQALARVYILNWEAITYLAILVLAIVTRFYDLGARVMSHDESLHTHYSWELYDFGKFEHTPLMHGPLLFHAVAFFYFLFGPSDFSARIYPALLGVLIVVFPVLWRRWLGRIGAILASIGLLISPMVLYYNRYIREDTPNLFWMLVMLYAALQYIDGKKPRQITWLAVFAAGMLCMLASKETAFMYIAIFGSFLTFYWLLRMAQDARSFNKTQKSTDGQSAMVIEDDSDEPVLYGWSNLIWWGFGHLVAFTIALVLGYGLGAIIYEFYRANHGFLPDGISERVFEALAALFILAILESIGLVRTLLAGGRPQAGLPWMVVNGLRNVRYTMMILTAGAILGAAIALWLICILDIIKANSIFVIVRELDQIKDIFVNEAELWHFIEWGIFPSLLLILIVGLIGAWQRTPWQDILAVLLAALVFMTLLLIIERHSLPSAKTLTGQPVAIDPNTEQASVGGDYNFVFILIAWIFCAAIVIIVLMTRLLTNWWDFMNRQPVFDILIVMGTLIFPWLAAFPLFWAGYVLDKAPDLPQDTIEAAIVTLIPFFMVSTSVGLSWNWRAWPVAVAVFGALFLIFFTTFFTNGYGVGTGLVGSLGYWLEQQDVQRGSQPQYYYLFLQLPVYEFLPMLLAIVAGFAGLTWLFEERAQVALAKRKATTKAKRPALDQEIIAEPAIAEAMTVSEHAAVEVSASVGTTSIAGATGHRDSDIENGDDSSDNGADNFEDDWVADNWHYLRVATGLPPWAQPYNHKAEISQRNSGDVRYLGGIPFLQLVGYWGVMILIALTIAGEKMPWLTIHLTIPLILIGGWFVGRVVEGLEWESIRRSGWILLLFVLPVFFIGIAQVALPLMTGVNVPFQGQVQEQLRATGQWIAALITVIITGYFALRLSVQIGFEQARRLFFTAGVILFAGLTMRAAWMFAYINYDYATEFGVYAHSSPVPKQIVADLMYLAERHPDGMNMKIAYDDDSSWPMLWYLRDFSNKVYFWGTAEDARNRAPDIEGSVAVIVGNRKNAEIERILGKDYYRFDLIRLWWPMQEYFNLSYQRIANVFKSDAENPAASLYRKGIWDIWWSRDYDRYAQAMCVEDKVRLECRVGDTAQQRQCAQNARITCERTADRFNVEKWPVSDELFLYIRKDFAVQIWDAGLNGLTVAERLIPDPEDAVYRDLTAMQSFGSGTLNGPRGLATDNQGNVYVADTNNSRVVVFNPQGEVLREIGTGVLREPWGLAVNPVDNYLYVADTWNFRVAVFTLTGDLVHTFGEGGVDSSLPYAFYGPRAIAIDREGLIYVADTGFHRIRVYNTDWQHVRDIVTNGAGLNNQPEPVGLAIHPISGELYIAETWNQRISVFRRDGTYVTGWSVNMWAGTRDSLNRPFLTISPDGTLILVSDMDASDDNNGPRVVAYDLRGNPVVAFNAPLIPSPDGTGGPTGVEIVGGLVYGPQGQLYVADALTSRILVFPSLGVSGSLSPVPDPTYVGDTIGSPATLGDEEAVQRVGYAYWQSLTTGDYELFKALHCPEDQTAADFPVDSAAFINFKAGPYIGASIRELAVFAGVNENQATLSWGGWLIFRPGTEQESRTGLSYVPLILVKRAGVWKICASPSTQPDNIFRPGGG